MDLNNDGDYADAGETNYYTSATLTDGTALITLPALPATGTYGVCPRRSNEHYAAWP